MPCAAGSLRATIVLLLAARTAAQFERPVKAPTPLKDAEREAARAELAELRPWQVPKDLMCEACKATVAILHKMREDKIEEGDDAQHIHHVGYHLSKAHNAKNPFSLCDEENFPEDGPITPPRMHWLCRQVVDHWDSAGMEADRTDEMPWRVYERLLPRARQARDADLLADEVAALCNTGKRPACPELKSEL